MYLTENHVYLTENHVYLTENNVYLTESGDQQRLQWWFGWFMVFKTTFNNISVISWRSVLLVGETRVPRENYRPVTSQ